MMGDGKHGLEEVKGRNYVYFYLFFSLPIGRVHRSQSATFPLSVIDVSRHVRPATFVHPFAGIKLYCRGS